MNAMTEAATPAPVESSNHRSPARVLVIEDNTLFRTALSGWIDAMADVEVCGEAASATKGLELVRELSPDLVIVDVNLPDGDGITLTRELLGIAPATAVLVLTAHDEAIFGLRALRAGALGYLVKDDVERFLAQAVRQTLRKEHFLPSRLISHLVFSLEHAERLAAVAENQDDLSSLTDREMEVFQWLSKGYGTKQIAETLNLGVKTIETHRANIMARLGLQSSEALMAHARSWRLRIMKVA